MLQIEDWQKRWEKLFEKPDSEGYESLTPDERAWYNVRGVIDSVNGGGIISYYYNHGADTLDDNFSHETCTAEYDFIIRMCNNHQLIVHMKAPLFTVLTPKS